MLNRVGSIDATVIERIVYGFPAVENGPGPRILNAGEPRVKEARPPEIGTFPRSARCKRVAFARQDHTFGERMLLAVRHRYSF